MLLRDFWLALAIMAVVAIPTGFFSALFLSDWRWLLLMVPGIIFLVRVAQ